MVVVVAVRGQGPDLAWGRTRWLAGMGTCVWVGTGARQGLVYQGEADVHDCRVACCIKWAARQVTVPPWVLDGNQISSFCLKVIVFI